jgi:hypothetical protein
VEGLDCRSKGRRQILRAAKDMLFEIEGILNEPLPEGILDTGEEDFAVRLGLA